MDGLKKIKNYALITNQQPFNAEVWKVWNISHVEVKEWMTVIEGLWGICRVTAHTLPPNLVPPVALKHPRLATEILETLMNASCLP